MQRPVSYTHLALVDAARKVDRSLKAGALAVGAEVEIETMAGYLPRITEPTLDEAFLKNSEALVGKGAVGIPVSYTHLDVYKRQSLDIVKVYIIPIKCQVIVAAMDVRWD